MKRFFKALSGNHKNYSLQEPNYELAKNVFLDFNDFNLKNLDIHLLYLNFVPQSLLPYPKNYIKCAYYIYLDLLEKEKKPELFKNVQEIGTTLFFIIQTGKNIKRTLSVKRFMTM